jgi:hypothetical protein
MLVCVRIHRDYFTFFIKCVSFFKGVGAIFSITIENNPALIRDELRLAGKYPDNTTIVHMDENGNYKINSSHTFPFR